ncbi:YcaO-like family protein [Spongiactinospora sp. 9N601]|uniref:YcaO-like family protein n=1 Tax=Spongiactinospora sp. 9N601 TaxID=3375149 RepID=UPI0037AED169
MIGVDSRLGVVTALRTGTLHGTLHVAFADLAGTGGHGLPLGNPTVSGASWHDPGQARLRALGEAAERYCGHLVPAARLAEATWHDLAPDAVDPAGLARYSAAQLRRPGFPFTGFARDDRIPWVRGTRPDGTPIWVPAELVWLAPLGARPAVLPVSGGIAAGPDPASARAAALAEVVERHALATAWLSGRRFPALPASMPPRVPGLRLRGFAVPNLIDAPVALCLAQDASGLLGVGCALAADGRIATSLAKAAAEAVQSLDTTARIAAGGLPEWERPYGPLAGHRPDRAYAAAYRPDFADAVDVTCHLQLLADPAFAARIAARFAPAEPWTPAPPCDPEAALAARGLTPITVDLTTPDVAACGMSVARVVVPGLRATTPAAFPMLGGGAEPLPARPCLLPIPHA